MASVNATQFLLDGLDISSSYGLYQVATITTCLLSGITTMQVYLYYWNYFEHDKLFLKVIVFVAWAADLVNLILIVRGEWDVEVLRWGSLTELAKSQTLSVARGDAEAVVVVIVQAFLIRRVWLMLARKTLFDRIVLFCILPVLTLWQIIGDIFEQLWALGKPLSELGHPRNVAMDVSIHATQAIVDLTVTVYLVWILVSQRTMVTRRAREMIGRLLVVIINTGLFTSMIAVASLIAYVVRPDGLYWIIFDYPITTVNLSCLLANLNSREFIRGPNGTMSVVDTTLMFQPGQTSSVTPESRNISSNAPISSSVWSKVKTASTARTATRDKVNIFSHKSPLATSDTNLEVQDKGLNLESSA